MSRTALLICLTLLFLAWLLLACGAESPAKAQAAPAPQPHARAAKGPVVHGIVEVGPAELVRPSRVINTAR